MADEPGVMDKQTNTDKKTRSSMSLGSQCEEWERQRLLCGMSNSDFIAHLLTLHHDKCTRFYRKVKGRLQAMVDSTSETGVFPRPPTDPRQPKGMPAGIAASGIQFQTSFDTTIRSTLLTTDDNGLTYRLSTLCPTAESIPTYVHPTTTPVTPQVDVPYRQTVPGRRDSQLLHMARDNPVCPPSEHQISQLNYNNTMQDAIYHGEHQRSMILPLNSTAVYSGYVPTPLYPYQSVVHSPFISTGTSVGGHLQSDHRGTPVLPQPKALEVEPIMIAPLGNPHSKDALVHPGCSPSIVPPMAQHQPPQIFVPQLQPGPPPYGSSLGQGGIQYVILNPSSGQIPDTNSTKQRPTPFILGGNTVTFAQTNDTLVIQPQSDKFNVEPVVIQPQINSTNKPNQVSLDTRQDTQQNDDICESSSGSNLFNYPKSNASPRDCGFGSTEENIHPSIPDKLAILPADEITSCRHLECAVSNQTEGNCSNYLTTSTVHSGSSGHSKQGREMTAYLEDYTETENKCNYKPLQRVVAGVGPMKEGDESEKRGNVKSEENVRDTHTSDRADIMPLQTPSEATSAKTPSPRDLQDQSAARCSPTSQKDIKNEQSQDENTTDTSANQNDMVLKYGNNNRKRKQTFHEDIKTKEDAQFIEQWPSPEVSVRKPNTKRSKLEMNQETTKRHQEIIACDNNEEHPKTKNEENSEEYQSDFDYDNFFESSDTEMPEKQKMKSNASQDKDWDPVTYHQSDSEEEAHRKKKDDDEKHSRKGKHKDKLVKTKKTTAKYHDIFQCDQCDAEFQYSWAHLVAHKIQEHPAPRDLNKCNICDTSFDDEVDLRKHAADVHAMDEFPDRKLNHLICPDCEESHPLALSYIFHREDKHESCIVTCLLCDFVADHRYQMKTHMHKAHDITTFVKYSASMVLKKTDARRCRRDGSRISCFMCGEPCDTLKDMVNHRKEKHANALQQEVFTCSVCNITSSTYRSMLTHYNAHMRNTQCRFCERIVTTDWALTKHVKDNHCHIKDFCEECNLFLKRFQKSGHIARVHHDVRKKLCETCGRGFKTHSALMIHNLIHTGENPISCSHCEYRCRQKTSLDWHMKRTHPDKVTVQADKPGGRPHGKALTKKNSNVKVQKPVQEKEIKKATLKQAGNNKAKNMVNMTTKPKYVENEMQETGRPNRKRVKKVMMDL